MRGSRKMESTHNSRQTNSLRLYHNDLAEHESPLWSHGRPGAATNSLPLYPTREEVSLAPRGRPLATENIKAERKRSHKARYTRRHIWNQNLEDGLLVAVVIACILFSLASAGVTAWLVVHVRSIHGRDIDNTTVKYSPSDSEVSVRPPQPPSARDNVSIHLSSIMQTLWDVDVSRLPSDSYQLSLQNSSRANSTTDVAPDSLFLRMSYRLESYSDSHRTLLSLQNDYTPLVGHPDPLTYNKMEDIEQFLRAVVSTQVMEEAHRFLYQQGLVGRNVSDFSQSLYNMWFSAYSRSPNYDTVDSSGFEHVFVGETQANGQVAGFYNWIKFYVEERAGNLDYFGVIDHNELLFSVQFQWLGHFKKTSTFFIGTSPEFEMAVYTICFLLYPDAPCDFTVDSTSISVITSTVKHSTGTELLSAHPVFV